MILENEYRNVRQTTEKLIQNLEEVRKIGESRINKPKVYFEEWFDPIISGITWVSEIIELCGGIDIYEKNRYKFLAKDRIIEDQKEIIELNPDIILASWCGKKFKKNQLTSREGWDKINAVKNNQIFEIKSEIILQPGPASITEGVETILNIYNNWENS
jgi:iron complex transport system substrate-binding protein